jgi:ribosomal protein S18 acetylase RimI-like enzyme
MNPAEDKTSASGRFVAEKADARGATELSAIVPASPFATPAYFDSRRRTGWTCMVLGLRDDEDRLTAGCAGFIKARGWNRKLEVPSLPPVGADSPFWPGFHAFCRRHFITKMELDSFGTPEGVEIPCVGTCRHRMRCEYILDLTGDIDARIDRRHKTHLKKAARAGLRVRRTRSVEAVAAHREMIGCSMDRRRARGEDVPFVGPPQGFNMLLESGAGELYQALRGDEVLASGLVLRAPEGAYFHSRGTSPEGMAIGASHFLLRHIMGVLKEDGVTTFNIGGADEGSGLARFKKRFGAQPVYLPSATCFVGPSWVREINRAVELFRSDHRMLLHSLTRRMSRLAVYATDLAVGPEATIKTCLHVRELDEHALRTMAVPDADFRDRQLQRLARFGASHAYGVYEDDRLANIAWLLPPAAIARDLPRVLKPRSGDAEITCAETLPEFRGRGLYSEVISCLVEQARECGMQRVFMKTAVDNTASRSGIEKAGLRRVGTVAVLSLPVVNRYLVWRAFN